METMQLIGNKLHFKAAHFAWAAMFLSILIWGLGEVRPAQLGNSGNWYRIVLVLLAAAVGTSVMLRNSERAVRAFAGPLFLLLVYGFVALISALYIPAHSFYSMWKGFEVIVDVIAIAAILSYPRPQDNAVLAYRIILASFGALLLIYWLEAFFVPSRAFLPSRGYIPFTMQGVLPQYNGNAFAFLSALLSLAAICRLSRPSTSGRRVLTLLFLPISLLSLILAQSRTSLIGFLAALLIYLYFDRRFRLFVVFASVAGSALLFTELFEVAERYLLRGQSEELFTSLSGRTEGWRAAWLLFQQSPILGHGFAAAARVAILGTEGASTLHGSVFDVLVGVGLLGLIPWVVAMIWSGIRLLRLSYSSHPWFQTSTGRSIQAEMLAVLTLTLVRSLTSSGLAMHEHTFMVFLSVLAYATSMRIATSPRTGVRVGSLLDAGTASSVLRFRGEYANAGETITETVSKRRELRA